LLRQRAHLGENSGAKLWKFALWNQRVICHFYCT
jgi:hypothetical protein